MTAGAWRTLIKSVNRSARKHNGAARSDRTASTGWSAMRTFAAGQSSMRLELLDFDVAVGGTDGERRASAIQLSVQLVALSAGLVVIHGERKRTIHVAVARMHGEVGGQR